MSKEKRKKIMIVSLAVILLLGGFYLVGVLFNLFQPPFFRNEEKMTSVETAIKAIEESFPTDVVILGEPIQFKYELAVRYVEEISDKTVGIKGDYRYQAIIINDLNGNVQLQDSEIAYLNHLIHTDGYMLLYLGKKYSDTWEEPSDYNISVEGNLSYIYYKYGSVLKGCIGSWKESDQEDAEKYPYLLGDVVIYDIQDYLEEVN